MLKAQWQKMIKDQSESGLLIREWCRESNISHGKFYYWQRVIREESLIKAGTLAVTEKNPICGGKRRQKKYHKILHVGLL